MNRLYLLLIVCIPFFFIACDDSEYDYDYVSPSLLNGIWQQTLSVDSIVMTFENSQMKRYVYQKGTNNILSRTDYGAYKLRKYTSPERTSIEIEEYDETDGWRKVNVFCILSGNKLTIKWRDGNETFTKVSN
ncbi:hypothetical protein [Dysgonomonas sp. 520]|uniref:hypothetical protein n=1 Tax=Dysgonomonas sp. 520 TaxID=2302931 RepID=UPI0013D69C82|nr:hypothetical protein [Dysgonomonas sp. 520]NDW10896.1 hypothetical protein [Dysgonomonas sp. 520]